mgnify:CR=1 FL=1
MNPFVSESIVLLTFRFSYNKNIQQYIVQKWQYIQRFNAVEEPIINSMQTQKTYGMTNLYR